MKPFKILKEETVFEVKGRYQVKSVDLETPEGMNTTWTYFSMKDAVVVVPIDDEGNTYVKQEWRVSRKDFAWEFASGWVEVESILDAASRELQEEIGYKADKMALVSSFFLSNHANNKFHIVIAKGLSDSKLEGDEHEHLDIKKVSLEQAHKLLIEDQVPSAQTLIAFSNYEIAVKNDV